MVVVDSVKKNELIVIKVKTDDKKPAKKGK